MKKPFLTALALFVAFAAVFPQAVLAQTPTDPGSLTNATTNNGPTPAVLGAQTCATKTNIQGFVFMDLNTNQQKDGDEVGVTNARVQVFDPADMNTALITVNTGQDGKWTGQICPGTYQVKVDQMPSEVRLLESNSKQITVATETLDNVNFRASEKSAVQMWVWWVVLLLVILVIAFSLWWTMRRRDRGSLK